MALEVCCESIESVRSALLGGCTGIELCSSLSEGGITPSYGLLKTVRRIVPKNVFLNVLIRPRPGDFLYSKEEIETIINDIEMCKNLNIDGIVFGCLTETGYIDEQVLSKAIEIATPMRVTFHRAFDLCFDPIISLNTLEKLGVSRLLTSGLASKAIDGIENIAAFKVSSKLLIATGGGVDESNASQLQKVSHELHGSLRCLKQSKMSFQRFDVLMGSISQASDAEYFIKITDQDRVKNLMNILKI